MIRFLKHRHVLSKLNRCSVVRAPERRAETAAAAPSALEKAHNFRPGSKLHGYTVERLVPIPELYLVAVQLRHDQTGAEHLHLAREDSNNMFGVLFRTTPMDSTGVPHILEHTTLCGSHKFPVRDPFFKMLDRSLSTFMNAFTARDFTMYPFSTQNPQDFENLLSVYLDAVFNPKLNQLDFRQEGWRLEHENPQDPKSPIMLKGVVFNEMKGVFSDSNNLFCQNLTNKLYPSHTYSVVSGGDPMCIPDLTYEQLKEFHASHYHPSNAKFITYGNFPLERHLELIQSMSLSHFEKIDPGTQVPKEQRWIKQQEAEISCRPDPMAPDPAKQTTVAVNYLLGDVTDIFDAACLQMICSLLMDGDTAPFYQSLLAANIGSDYCPSAGYDPYAREACFSIGLKNIHEDDVSKVKQIIDDTIDGVIENGFDPVRVEALLHQIELGLKKQSANYGLHLAFGVSSVWNHDGDTIAALQTNAQLEKLHHCMKENPRFLQEKVQEYFRDNPHKLTLTMKPDANFEEQQKEKHQALLETKLSALKEEDKLEVYETGLKLAEYQVLEEDVSCLPTLKVSDINKEIKRDPFEIQSHDGVSVQYNEQPMNGITQFRAFSNMSSLSEELTPYVTLFCNVVTKMGAGAMDFKDLSQKIDLKTGGLYSSAMVFDNHSNLNSYEPGIMFSSYCLDRNVPDMFALWTEIFNRVALSDIERLTTLIHMTASEMASSVIHNGHNFAMMHAAMSQIPSAHLTEVLSGMTQVSFMKNVAEMQDLTHVVDNLNRIASHVLNKNTIRCSINANADSMSMVTKNVEEFITDLPVHGKTIEAEVQTEIHHPMAEGLDHKKTQFELPLDVHFTAKCCKTVPYTHEEYPLLRVLARVMSMKQLHREIREKGGAYGGGATGMEPGLLKFYSYRDPNCMKTFSTFDSALSWAAEGNFKQQDVDEAILAVFQKVDKPVPPQDKGLILFGNRITDDMRQKHREQLLAATREQLIAVANKYNNIFSETSSMTFLGPPNTEAQESHKLPDAKNHWFIKKE